jgi:hypothetical protein
VEGGGADLSSHWLCKTNFELNISVYKILRLAVSDFTCMVIPHWPLPAVRDLTRDGRLSTNDEVCTQHVQGFILAKMHMHTARDTL